MTIDETIESLKCDYEIDMYIHDIAPQIAEWLEELKVFKECNISKTNFRNGYNKGIKDFESFADRLEYQHNLKDDWHMGFRACISKFREKAEQLKAGGVNE